MVESYNEAYLTKSKPQIFIHNLIFMSKTSNLSHTIYKSVTTQLLQLLKNKTMFHHLLCDGSIGEEVATTTQFSPFSTSSSYNSEKKARKISIILAYMSLMEEMVFTTRIPSG
ncbi:hypothetical protein KSP39_PZI001533 [Platanthera zijinensis]|uniref:Uncharacterized protein n=1 Tax=Platanthera zijinensis TaxID=2320716 RepID=A0AAP0GFL0_9ASPA